MNDDWDNGGFVDPTGPIAEARASGISVSTEHPPSSGEAAGYRLLGVVGRGGMGIVHAAQDARLGRLVAIKRMLATGARDPLFIRRFWIEAQVCAQLEHPNIVPVYAIEGGDADLSFTMRLLDQRTLEDVIREARAPNRDPALSLANRLQYVVRIADAIGYAHARGVIHRDLKPANIMLGQHGELYVVDWGVAKIMNNPGATICLSGPALPSSDKTRTQVGDVVGTPTYMPPEQAYGALEQHGPASDQYALGMVLQELITLESPRQGNTMDQIVAAAEGERSPMRGRDRAVPIELQKIVARATAATPADRYPHVSALADDVSRYLRSEPVSVHQEGLAAHMWRRLSRRPALTLGTGLGVLVVALLGAVASLGWNARAQSRAAVETARLGEIAGAVVRQSEAVDSRFARAAEVLEGVAVAATMLHEGDRERTGPLPFGAAGQLAGRVEPSFSDLHDVPGYDYPISFTRATFHYPASAGDEVRHHLRVMPPLERALRTAYLRSLDEEAPSWPQVRQRSVMDAGEVPLWAIYVAFEDGLMLSFPGWIPLSDGYDARHRPWYQSVAGRTGIHCGNPYPDAGSGAVILPCNRALWSTTGEFLGVAGADYKLDDLAEMMHIDTPGWVRSSLVDGDGRELVNTDQRGLRLEHADNNTAETAAPLPPALWTLMRQEGTGWWRNGEEIVFFDPLEEPGWSFVSHFHAETALASAER